MASAMIKLEHNKEIDHYEKALKKISKELKENHSAEVVKAIDETLAEEHEAQESIGAKIWFRIQNNIQVKE